MKSKYPLCINCKYSSRSSGWAVERCVRQHLLTGFPQDLDQEHQRINSWFGKCGKKARYFEPKEGVNG